MDVSICIESRWMVLRQDIIWNKPNPMPESVKDRCTKAHEYIFFIKQEKGTTSMTMKQLKNQSSKTGGQETARTVSTIIPRARSLGSS